MTWRWGLAGTGSICGQFARDLPFVKGAELAAVASRDLQRAQGFAGRHGVGRAYGDYAEMLADPLIDIVYIGSPHSEHRAQAAAALKAGKHVLCEKPLTTNVAEAEALIETWENSGRYLMEAMWTWFLPAIDQALAWVAEGRIGTLRHVKADFGYPQLYEPEKRMYDPALGGGALLDMGVYPVALAWLLRRQMPASVAVTARRAENGVCDDLVAVLEYPGHIATLATSFRCKLQNWAYLIGREGYIAVPDFWRAREALLFRLDEQVEHFVDPREHQGFAYEAVAVQRDLEAGRTESPVIPLGDSLAIQRLMEAIDARC